jgi:hypothetical protein
MLPTIWHTYMKLVTKYQIPVINIYTPTPQWRRGVYCFTSVRPSIQDIFRRIFLSNCWWQKSDIWSQASYRYTILWVAFLDPSDSLCSMCIKINKVGKQEVGIWWIQKCFPQYGIHIWSLWPNIRFLSSIFIPPLPNGGGGYTVLPLSVRPSKIFFVEFFSVAVDGRNLIFGHKCPIGIPYCGNSCWEKCDEKWAYMFNVYKNQQSRQTGSRNMMGPKTLPMIWGTYMKLVTKYQISAYFLFTDFVYFYTHLTYICICTFFVAFF